MRGCLFSCICFWGVLGLFVWFGLVWVLLLGFFVGFFLLGFCWGAFGGGLFFPRGSYRTDVCSGMSAIPAANPLTNWTKRYTIHSCFSEPD